MAPRPVTIVAAGEANAGALAAAVAACGRATRSCAPEGAAAALRASPTDLLLVDAALADATLRPILAAAAAAGAVTLLGIPAGPAPATAWRRALALDCAGVLPAEDRVDAIAALELAQGRWRQNARLREEAARLHQQNAELRRRIALDAERHQETQETFFLDLSRMMTIVTNIMDGIVFVDRAGSVTLLNPAAEDLLGVRSFVAIGKQLRHLQGRQELLEALVADHERGEGQREAVRTVEVHHSEQDLLYIECRTNRVLDYRGQPAGTLSVLRDVTAEFKADQLKNQYLSIVAHELRTPLTGIKTFATMLAKGRLGSLDERQQKAVESMREQSQRLEHQIDKLINLGQIEAADYGQDREPVRVAELLAGLLAPFEQPARDRRIRLAIADESAGEVLFADRADLRRACQALVENAVKFARDGGAVTVRVYRDATGALRISVRDDGIGIDPRYHRRIFEKFFQVEDPLTRHHGGAGLGLFVAKGIVEAHGSRIEVSSRLGEGADFTFALPELQPGAVAASTGIPATSQ
ncbi:MAG: PAS domain-containing protein [Planctomycetes bacterium]|nr:PAS domain-containing protein [Planctomycetota bacterium]